MAICETCGGKYVPTTETPGCPRCSGEKKAAAPASGPRPVKRASASPAAAPRPAATARPAAASKPRPQAAPRRAQAAEDEDADGPIEIHHREPEGVLDQSAKIGLIAAGGLAVIVIAVVVIVSKKHAEDKRIELAYQNEVKDLYTELSKLNLDDEIQAKRVLTLAKEKEGRWRNHELSPQILTLVARAGASLETGKERRESLGRFTEIEKLLQDPSKVTPETLNDLRRSLAELESKITLGGEEYLKRYADARTTADKAYVTRLVDAAKENAANPRAALVDSQKAEDELRALLEQANLEKKQELQDFYADMYKKAIAQSDEIATSFFTEKVIGELPWIDCLSGDQVKNWNFGSQAIKGFERDVRDGVLRVVGPDPDTGRQAVISIGDREQWRNFVLDMEYTVEKGNLEVFLRLGRSPNANTISLPWVTEAGEQRNRQAGKTYHVMIRLIGSKISVRHADEDDLDTPAIDETLSWAKLRKGAIGFLIPPSTRFQLKSMKVRELR